MKGDPTSLKRRALKRNKGDFMRLYIGLLHYPVYNKNNQTIASAITNFDLHDLSRLSMTYGVRKFFIITPLDDQRMLAERIILHWTNGYGARYNIDRKEAFKITDIARSLEEAIDKIREIEGEKPILIATDAAKRVRGSITFSRTIEILNSEKTVLILFGTAWGLHEEVIDMADFMLEPISGKNGYNHLSVRTAAGIILDRLAGIR
ncbi:MAG TPA: RNA methyltransferase [Desulfatiglandales bacterium]|nr:RNA methyltransferase [Desulfatiglandales bacterium]